MDQGTKEWHKWRDQGLGSSDAAVIMGANPWKTLHELYCEKLNLFFKDERGNYKSVKQFKGNYFTERGQALEPVVRREYEASVGLHFLPSTAVHDKYDWVRASFDGINLEKKKIIEIKTSTSRAHDLAMTGVVPDYYYPQVQWLLMVCGYDSCEYISHNPVRHETKVINVLRSRDYQKEMLGKAYDFWQKICEHRKKFEK